MAVSVVDSLTCLYFLSLLLMVIVTNVKPYLDQESVNIQRINHTIEVDLDETLMKGVVINQCMVLILGEHPRNKEPAYEVVHIH